MRKLTTLFFCFAVWTNVYGQKIFKNGDNIVSAGAGIGPHGAAVQVAYERCILDHLWDDHSSLGIGGAAGWYSERYKVHSHSKYYNYSRYVLGVRGSLHYHFVDDLDTYVGGLVGYAFDDEDIVDINGVEVIGYIGARYYFSRKFGAYLEAGVGVTNVTGGLFFKF